MRYRLVLEYDGAGFSGWQLQPDRRTVQGVVEEALAALFGHPVRVAFAGRTDAGVHARGQVVAFDSDVQRTARAVREAMNARLPEDVACVEAAEAPSDFDPRRWSLEKHYRYRWVVRPGRSPLRRGQAWHVRSALDVGAMGEAGAALVGWHDLSSFRGQGCTAKHPRRFVEEVSLRAVDDEVHLDVRGNGFLKQTVRIVAGTLYEIGLGRRPPGWFAEVLAARDRTRAGRTAPPQGLVMMGVRYGDGPPPWHDPGEE